MSDFLELLPTAPIRRSLGRVAPTTVAILIAGVASLVVAACGSEFAEVTEGDIADITPNPLAVPHTPIGRSFNTQFTIANNGEGPLSLKDITINSSPYLTFNTGFLTEMAASHDWRADRGGQSWTQSPDFTLGPNQSIQVDLLFAPEDTSLACPTTESTGNCGEIVISTDDRDEPTVTVGILLSQSSGSIDVEPTVLRFPDIVGGPFEDAFVITNVGAGPLEIQRVSDPRVEGIVVRHSSNRPEPFTLDQAETAEYEVIFTPDSSVDYCPGGVEDGCTLGTVTIESDDADGRQVIVSLQVGGVSVPDIDVSTRELIFDAAVGAPDTQTVDVGNTGGANLNWNLRIDPPENRDLFAIDVGGTSYPPSGAQMPPLEPSNTATVALTLDPVDESTVRGQLIILAGNDPDEAVTSVELFAGPPAAELDVEPVQLYFPEINPGQTADLGLTLINLGRATLNISSGVITGSTEFTLSPPLTGSSIGAGERLHTTVTYSRPVDDFDGLDQGTLTIESNALEPNDRFRVDLFAWHEPDALPPTAVIDVTPAEPYSVGEEITLDAGSSSPPAAGEFSDYPFSWTLSARPAGSAAALSNDYLQSTTLTPDVSGTYTVILTVTTTITGSSAQTQSQAVQNLFVE